MSDLEVITDPLRAAELLRAGGLVAVPTETVYGLAAVASDPSAVARVYEVKGRPREHPLIVHIAEVEDLDIWARDIPPTARQLAEACWPGPLTLLLLRSETVPDIVTGGRDTVAIRLPANELTRTVIRFAGAIVAPSANLFGRVSPTTATHVVDDLTGALDADRDAILDGGRCPVGIESTIVDCTCDPPVILRPGGLTSEDITRLIGSLGVDPGPSRASGMLAHHYAPRTPMRLVESDEPLPSEIDQHQSGKQAIVVIDRSDDLVAYARDLYRLLREADQRGAELIIARLPAASGLGLAIRDRLGKAAASPPANHQPTTD
jgi:L-threonylcarbamoyladenylate synthase